MVVNEEEDADCKQRFLLANVLPWLPTLGWMIVIFCFSAQPNSAAHTGKLFGDYNFTIRKFSHMFEYAVLYLLSRRGWSSTFSPESPGGAATTAGALISIFYALTDEWHQSYVPGRSASIEDVLIDSFGVAAAWAANSLLNKLLPSSKRRA